MVSQVVRSWLRPATVWQYISQVLQDSFQPQATPEGLWDFKRLR